jgi:hypothetical protein
MTTVHRAAIAVGFVPQPSESADPADGRFAPQASVPEKSAFDLDRATTSSEGRRPGGQIQGLSQAAIAEIKRFDPDGVHDAVKL